MRRELSAASITRPISDGGYEFFEHLCYIHFNVPRINTTSEKVSQIEVPWAHPGSRFTLLFEAFAMYLIEKEMPVK